MYLSLPVPTKMMSKVTLSQCLDAFVAEEVLEKSDAWCAIHPSLLPPSLMRTTTQVLPALQEECKQSASCATATKHFAHCQEKVNAGEGFHGENCIEELYVPRCL